MARTDARQWLEQWAANHLGHSSHVEAKAEMHDPAEACVAAAREAGFSVADMKEAANGDVEVYLMRWQNAGGEGVGRGG